jgi:NADH dehydrogenase
LPSTSELIAVDGAEMYLGRALVREFIARGHPVRAIVLGRAERVPAGAEIVQAPLGDQGALSEALAGARSVVMARKLLAELPAEGLTFQAVHADRTHALLEASAQAGASRFLYVGLAGANRGGPRAMMNAEIQAEALVAGSRIQALCLKSSLVVGPGDGHVSRLANKAQRPGPFLLFVGQGWARSAPMPCRDFARCVAILLTREEFPCGELGLGGRERLTAMEILQRLLIHYGRRKVNVHLMESLARAGTAIIERISSRPPVSAARLSWLSVHRVPRSNAARGLLGRFPRPFERAFPASPGEAPAGSS